jgi:hypothetical protein
MFIGFADAIGQHKESAMSMLQGILIYRVNSNESYTDNVSAIPTLSVGIEYKRLQVKNGRPG